MDDFISKDNFLGELSTYVTSCDVELFGVLTLELREHDDGGTTAIRGLLIASFHREIVDTYTAFLMNGREAAFLELVECSATTTTLEGKSDDGSKLIHVCIFKQENARMGRKQIAPILLGGANLGMGGTPRL